MKQKKQARRHTTDVSAVALQLVNALEVLGSRVSDDDIEGRHALHTIESFGAIALRVMSKSPPALIISETKTVEIAGLLTKSPVSHFDGFANQE